MNLRSTLLLLLLPALACSTPGRLPEGPLKAALPLRKGALVHLESKVSFKSSFDGEQLGELLGCALEQCPAFDFHRPPPGSVPALRPAARVLVELQRLDSSPRSFSLAARIQRLGDGRQAWCRVPIELTRSMDLLAGVDALGRTLRRTLGEEPSSILASTLPVARICTSRPQALARLSQARRQVRRGDPQEALHLLRQALRADPTCGRAMVLEASILAELNQAQPAYHVLNKARFTSPSLTPLDQHRLERVRFKLQADWEGLLTAGRKLLELLPASPQGRMSRGMALNHLGRYGEAEQELTRVLSRRPSSAPVLLQLGIARFGRGDHAGAARAWAGLADLGVPPFDAAFYQALALLAQGRGDQAATLLREGRRQAKGSARTRARFGRCLCATALLEGDLPAARQEIDRILADGCTDPLGCLPEWTMACRLLLFLGQVERVKGFLRALPRGNQDLVGPRLLITIGLRGMCAALEGEATLARNAMEQLRRQGRAKAAFLIEALLAVKEEKRTVRLAALEQVVARQPSSFNSFKLGRVRFELGLVREARASLEPVTRQGLKLDLDRPGNHPLANPLSALALVESRRLLARLDRIKGRLGGGRAE